MNFDLLSKTTLFHGIKENELEEMLPCLNANIRHYKKGELIHRAGDVVSQIGLVEKGSVNIVVNFYWGGSNIFGHIERGDIFAEVYAAIPGQELVNDVIAAEDSDIIFFDMNKLMTTCQKGCPFHHRLIYNLIQISAKKNLSLSTRMMHTASKSIRGRLLSYLSEQAFVHGSSHFSIPFSRQELADYLSVDRSALSNELSKMQKDGIITYKKNDFTLHEGARIT